MPERITGGTDSKNIKYIYDIDSAEDITDHLVRNHINGIYSVRSDGNEPGNIRPAVIITINPAELSQNICGHLGRLMDVLRSQKFTVISGGDGSITSESSPVILVRETPWEPKLKPGNPHYIPHPNGPQPPLWASGVDSHLPKPIPDLGK